MQSSKMQELVCQAIDDSKGRSIRVLDVRSMSDVTDYMIVASGTSARHVTSVADKVIQAMEDHGCRPLGVEGKQGGEWVLVDFGDVLVHIMLPEIREFYNLEKLWGCEDTSGIVES